MQYSTLRADLLVIVVIVVSLRGYLYIYIYIGLVSFVYGLL